MHLTHDLQLIELQAICLVVETGSVGSAALRLGYSQPQLSRIVMRAERRLGLRLFERSGRGAVPTEAAQSLLPLMKSVLETSGRLLQAAESRSEGGFGTLRIGYTPLAALTALGDCVVRLRRLLPNHRLALQQGSDGEIERGILSGGLDLGLVHPPLLNPHLALMPVHFDRMVAVIPEAFAGGEEIALVDLVRLPILLPPEALWPYTRKEFVARCRSEGVVPDLEDAIDDAVGRIALVAAGIGATLASNVRRTIPVPGVQFAPLLGHADFGFETAIALLDRRREPWTDTVRADFSATPK